MDVPYSDVSRLAVNGLPVNDSVYILDSEFEYIGKQLISKEITVEYIKNIQISYGFTTVIP